MIGDSNCYWVALLVICAIGPFWFVNFIWRESVRLQWKVLTKDARTAYVDAMKTVASTGALTAGLVSAVVSGSLATSRPHTLLAAKWTVASLVTSIITAVATIFALTRSYERARSRFPEHPAVKEMRAGGQRVEMEQGELSSAELLTILTLAFISFTGFLYGFVVLAHLVFL